jgi:hypothetical protein
MKIAGVVLMDNVKWLSFHSGYDFGYLLKILTCQNLPQVSGLLLFFAAKPQSKELTRAPVELVQHFLL